MECVHDQTRDRSLFFQWQVAFIDGRLLQFAYNFGCIDALSFYFMNFLGVWRGVCRERSEVSDVRSKGWERLYLSQGADGEEVLVRRWV